MNKRKSNDPVSELEREVKALRNQLARLNAEIETMRQNSGHSLPHDSTPDKPESVNTEPTVRKERPRAIEERKPWWKTALKISGVVAAIVYTVTTVVQWKDLRRNFEADERAWIKIQYGWPDLPSYQPAAIGTMKVLLANVGKSTTKRIEAHAVMEVVDGSKAPSFKLRQYHSALFSGPIFPTENTEFPVELLDQNNQPRPFTQTEFDGLQNGTLYLAVFGYVSYEDQFGVHWYRFCNWKPYVSSRTDFEAQACVPFNQVGDDLGTLQMEGFRK